MALWGSSNGENSWNAKLEDKISAIFEGRRITLEIRATSHLWLGRAGSWLQINRLSLRNNRLKFKTAGNLPINLEEFYRIYPNLIKESWTMSTCNRLDLQTLGSQMVMPKNLPDHCFTHKIESPWPLHFNHSHWWKRQSRSKFASHYAWGTNGVCECKMNVKSTWIPTWHQMDHVSMSLGLFLKTTSGGRLNTKLGDQGTPNAHNCWFILFDHVWGHAWIRIHWNCIWLKAWSHMTSHYTWGSATTLDDLGGVLRRPLDTFFWALAISWSRLLERVWSGP